MKFDRLFLIVALTTLLCACAVMTARADMVTDWNDKVVTAGVKASQAPFVHTRSAAIVHVAMFDAVNSIDRRYTPYRVQSPAAPGTSREAAAAAAAHFALVRLYPDQVKDFDSFYQTSLTTVPDGQPKSNGIQLGEAVAAEILALRAKDGANAPNSYRPYTVAGIYVPTALPVASGWGQVTPFALKEGSQFRPAAPVSLQSAQWAKDCDEVKKMGAKTGSGRTAEQTDIARLWEFTGPGLHNPVARQLAATKNSIYSTMRACLRCTPWRWLILTSRYSTLSTPTTSGGRSRRSATLISTAMTPPSAIRLGSLLLLRLCTLNIRALIASIALPAPPYSKPFSAMRRLPSA